MPRLVEWTDPNLAKITRIRFTRSYARPDVIEVTECFGELGDGRETEVKLPFRTLPIPHYYGAMLDFARKDDVFLKGLGIFNGTKIIIRWGDQ